MDTKRLTGQVRRAQRYLLTWRFLQVLLLILFGSSRLVFAQATYGIGGYDLASPADRVIAFDYDSSGKADHLVLYRPGTGTVWILENSHGAFAPIYQSSAGIGGYDFMSPNDRMFAFDYTSSGHLDHLVCYRPGSGVIYIVANNHGSFSPVYTSGAGAGGFDLMSISDIGFAYDIYSSGHYDGMIFYRPGTGVAYVLNNTVPMTGGFTATFISGYGGGGLGEFDLTSSQDRLIPFNIPQEMGSNDLVAYRPGDHLASFILGYGNYFGSEYLSTSGIAGYDLSSSADELIPFDYSGTGMQDHLIAYRPGDGIVWILQFVGPIQAPTFFAPVYQSFSGIGGFDLRSTADRIISFDYNGSGVANCLLLYRPGTGVVWILKNNNGTFSPVYASSQLPPGYPD